MRERVVNVTEQRVLRLTFFEKFDKHDTWRTRRKSRPWTGQFFSWQVLDIFEICDLCIAQQCTENNGAPQLRVSDLQVSTAYVGGEHVVRSLAVIAAYKGFALIIVPSCRKIFMILYVSVLTPWGDHVYYIWWCDLPLLVPYHRVCPLLDVSDVEFGQNWEREDRWLAYWVGIIDRNPFTF